MTVDGAHLVSCFEFKRERSVWGLRKLKFHISTDTHLYGLGYSFVDINEHSMGLRSRLWVLATPIDGTYMELVLAGQTQEVVRPKRPIVGFRILPRRARARFMNRRMLAQQVADAQQDIDIWERKRFQPRPVLSRADGKIMEFRRFCRQFYPEVADIAEQPRIRTLG